MDKIIYQVSQLRCNPQKAFEMFTVNEHVEKWLTKAADIEPEVGGKYELFWNLDDKEHDSTIGCRITALHPGRLLAFEWKGPQQFEFMNQVRPLTHVVVAFIPEGEGTEVHLIHTGWLNTAAWEEARQWFEKAWILALSELKTYSRG